MNKKELVDCIVENLDKKVSRKAVEDVVAQFMTAILTSVEKGESVKLVGFMNINLKLYKDRMTRNPKTGKVSKTPASVKAVAKLGASFKEAAAKIKPAKFKPAV